MLVVSDCEKNRGSAPRWCGAIGLFSDGHRALDDLVLQHDAHHQEDEVQHEHNEAQQLAHAPLAGGDGDDDEEEHEEEEHDGTEEAIRADLHGTQPVDQAPQEPREGQPAETNTRGPPSTGLFSVVWADSHLFPVISLLVIKRYVLSLSHRSKRCSFWLLPIAVNFGILLPTSFIFYNYYFM